MSFTQFTAMLLLVSTLGAAMLTPPNYARTAGLPSHATHLSYDDHTGEITAYNGLAVLGKYPSDNKQRQVRDTGSCVAVTAPEVQARMVFSPQNFL